MGKLTIPLSILSEIEDPTTLRFFLWCLVQAVTTETISTVRGQTITLAPGQFVFNRRRATAELEGCGLTERKIRTALSRCVASQKTSQKTSQKITIITVENFSAYEIITEASVPKNVPKSVPKRENKVRQTSKTSVASNTSSTRNTRNTRNTNSKEKHPKLHESIERVFQHYRKTFPTFGRTVRPGHKDWNLIGDRVKDGYSVDECIYAINGNSIDEWYKQKSIHSIKYIFKDAAFMDRFIATWQRHHRPVISEKAKLSLQAAKSWADRPEETHDTRR